MMFYDVCYSKQKRLSQYLLSMSSNMWEQGVDEGRAAECIYIQSDHTIGEWENDVIELNLSIGREEENSQNIQNEENEPHFTVLAAAQEPTQVKTEGRIGQIQQSLELLGKAGLASSPEFKQQSNNTASSEQVGDSRQKEQNSETLTVNQCSAHSYATAQTGQVPVSLSPHMISLRTFQQMNAEHYRPHLFALKQLYHRIKTHNHKSLNNLKVCRAYLEQKYKQEKARMDAISEGQLNEWTQGVDSRAIYDGIYMEEKLTLKGISSTMGHRYRTVKDLCDKLRRSLDNLNVFEHKITQRRNKKEHYIETKIIEVSERIQQQMEEIIQRRLNLKQEREVAEDIKVFREVPFIKKDLYLQMRYLINREDAYLNLIKSFNINLISYITNSFEKEETLIFKVLTETLSSYLTASQQAWSEDTQEEQEQDKLDQAGHAKQFEQITGEKGNALFEKELVKTLLALIPSEMYVFIGNCSETKLSQVIHGFHLHLQNVIFIKTIQMFEESILFEGTAYWSVKEVSENEHPDITCTLNQMNTEKRLESPFEARKDDKRVRVQVILSSNLFLHLEKDNRVASLKLSETKVSKKGRQIVLFTKKKVLGSYFGLNNEVGRIEFGSSDDVDLFIDKMRKTISSSKGHSS